MIPMRNAITALTTMALVAALSSTVLAASDPEPAELTGIDWTLTSITTEGATTAVPEGVTATLSLLDGDANGSGGCNRFSANYKVDGAVLGFGLRAVTLRGCRNLGQAVEEAYLAALDSVTYWAIAADGTLRLLDEAQSELLSFNAGASGIEGVTWILRQQAVGDTQAEIPEGIVVSLSMDGGQAGGNGGCNSYRAGYQLGESTIAIDGIASTLKACQEPAGTVEATYFGNLGQASQWETDGELLTLTDDDSAPLLSFEAAPQASVVGSWTAQSINNGSGGVVSSETTTSVTAQFSEDGDLTGFDGCNDYFTTYQLDGDTIAISDAIGATKKACLSDDLTVQVQEYYAALGAATTWSVSGGGDLQLRDDAGSLQVDYAALDS